MSKKSIIFIILGAVLAIALAVVVIVFLYPTVAESVVINDEKNCVLTLENAKGESEVTIYLEEGIQTIRYNLSKRRSKGKNYQ